MAQQCPQEWDGPLPEEQVGGKSEGAECTEGSVGESDAKRACGGPIGEFNVPGERNKVLQGKGVEECVKSLMISQMRECYVHVEEGIMTLLQGCLEADTVTGLSNVALSGYVEHFESKRKEDLGWGCGWRNIQMLCSHILSQDAEVKEVMFGGAGFVPDIPAAQRWLEIAWANGFDNRGAKYFDWHIAGTEKCIGTTECASLLRSFGVRARIVDFQTVGSKRERKDGPGKSGSGSTSKDKGDESELSAEHNIRGGVSHEGECGVCGEGPSSGVQRSTDGDSYTYLTCLGKEEDDSNQESEENIGECSSSTSQITGKQRGDWNDKAGSGGGQDSDVSLNHQHMVNWIWNYFLEGRHKKFPSKSLTMTNRSPLYFQHRGHSRTIVGIERRRKTGFSKSDPPKGETVNLIVLDPSQGTDDIVRALRAKEGWERFVKRGTHTLKQAEYQICYMEHGLAKGEELDGLKVLTSVHYTY